MTGSSIPANVNGDYVLVAPNHSGPLSIHVTGTLVVVALPTGLSRAVALERRAEVEVVLDPVVSSEVAPWAKTGGLADVLGGLPALLAAAAADHGQEPQRRRRDALGDPRVVVHHPLEHAVGERLVPAPPGDAGALGVKARMTLRRTPRRVRTTTASTTSPFFTVPSGAASLMCALMMSPMWA